MLYFQIVSGCGSVGRVRGLGPWGRRFESSHPDHYKEEFEKNSSFFIRILENFIELKYTNNAVFQGIEKLALFF